MRVLGIDPGTVTSGYGVVDKDGSGLKFVDAGGITTSAKLSFPERLKRIYDGLEEVIGEHRPEAVALEGVFFAKNVQSALKLGHARGVAVLAAVNMGLPVYEYTALQIKQSVVGYGAAEKEQVQRMVKAILGLGSLPRPHDASDALAAAICHHHSAKLNRAMSSALGAKTGRARR